MDSSNVFHSLLKDGQDKMKWVLASGFDRLFGESRIRESFWQFKLDTFAPKGLNVRLVDS